MADYGGTEVDAALLQAVTLRLLPPGDPRLARARSTRCARDLEHDGWLLRYRTDDGFGVPSVAFMLCTFWLVEALAADGAVDEARTLMEQLKHIGSPLGLLSEDLRPQDGPDVGQLPAGVLARRVDPRRLRRLAAVDGRGVSVSGSGRGAWPSPRA